MLVFFFSILGILVLILVVILLTVAKIEVNNLYIKDNKKEKGEIKLVLKILGIIPYFELDLLNSKVLSKKINLKQIEKNMSIKNIKNYNTSIKEILLIIKIEEIYTRININFPNLVLASFTAVIISTILSTFFAKHMISKENGKYKVNINNNENLYEIYLNCIVSIKLIHIMSVMCENIKKRSGKKYARKSNRRTYEYNNE